MVETSRAGGWLVVRLTGDVDFVSGPPIEDDLERFLARGQHLIRFDVTEVEFMDSIGLRVVGGAYRTARAEGGRVEVVGATEELRRLFELSGMGFLLKSA